MDSKNDETPYKLVTIANCNNDHTERDICVITTNSNKEEYSINTKGYGNVYVELFYLKTAENYA